MSITAQQPVTLTPEQFDTLWWQSKWIRNRSSELGSLKDALDTLGCAKGVAEIDRAQAGLSAIADDIRDVLGKAWRADDPPKSADLPTRPQKGRASA